MDPVVPLIAQFRADWWALDRSARDRFPGIQSYIAARLGREWTGDGLSVIDYINPPVPAPPAVAVEEVIPDLQVDGGAYADPLD